MSSGLRATPPPRLTRTSPWDVLGTSPEPAASSLRARRPPESARLLHKRARELRLATQASDRSADSISRAQYYITAAISSTTRISESCSKRSDTAARQDLATRRDATASTSHASHPHARSPRKRQDPPRAAAAAPHPCTRRRRRAAAVPRVLRAADRKWRRPRRLPVVAVAAGASESPVPRDSVGPELGADADDAVLADKGD